MKHILQILKLGSTHTWDILAELRPQSSDSQMVSLTGIQFLGSTAIGIVQEQASSASPNTVVLHQALPLIQELLDSSRAGSLKSLRLEEVLIKSLSSLLRQPGGQETGALQTIFLKTITRSIAVSANSEPGDGDIAASSTASLLSPLVTRPPSVERSRNGPLPISTPPPPELLDCIKSGLSSPSSRLFLDHWIQFISEILPLYSDAIFSAMIPLVECFCEQINLAFQYVQSIYTKTPFPHDPIPISTLPALLQGLELVLANAHQRLQEQDVASPIKSPEPTQSFFGSMVTNTFSSATPTLKSPRGNSRLTVILCVQDALRTCFAIWKWASHSADGPNIDSSSAATLSFNSLKLRHRTKRILEHLFAAESLECLETLAVTWIDSRRPSHDRHDDSDVFSLLHVLGASKPRVTLPVVLNALYSRTSVEALDVSRRSSLTSDLSALDLASFLLQYVYTLEDDAMDEIWADCTTFLRDVLSNPLPHRQILPALLEFIDLISEKIDNTNFGDLRKMHRELGVRGTNMMRFVHAN